MKNSYFVSFANFSILFLLSSFLFFACSSEKTPPSPVSLAETQKILIAKKWKVVDVGIVQAEGSASVKAVENETKITAPISVKWINEMDFSKMKMPGFYKNYLEKAKKITFDIGEKNNIKTTGMDFYGEESYKITDEKDDKNQIGIRLIISGKNKSFEMASQVGTIQMTYFILGIDQKRLYLNTDGSLNKQKIVYLLEKF
jgi:hypothetical protein